MAWDRIDLGETEATVLAGVTVSFYGICGRLWRRMSGPLLWCVLMLEELSGGFLLHSWERTDFAGLSSSPLCLCLAVSAAGRQGTLMRRQLAEQ